MARRCENCIHDKVCNMWAVDSGIPFVNADTCEHFKSTSDVVPKSEVASEIFEEIESVLSYSVYPQIRADGTIKTIKSKDLTVCFEDYETIKKKYTEDK